MFMSFVNILVVGYFRIILWVYCRMIYNFRVVICIWIVELGIWSVDICKELIFLLVCVEMDVIRKWVSVFRDLVVK